MRPVSSRIVLAVVALLAVVAGIFTPLRLLLLFSLVPIGILLSSILGMRRALPAALVALRGHKVAVQCWGAPLSEVGDRRLVLTAVNVLGAGVHLFFRLPDGHVGHLKIAQPTGAKLTPGMVLIPTAKYVQWDGAKLSRAPGREAVQVEDLGEDATVSGAWGTHEQ